MGREKKEKIKEFVERLPVGGRERERERERKSIERTKI